MKTIYVNLKCEITAYKEVAEGDGMKEVYRVRMSCSCHPSNNRRSGILVIQGGEVLYKIIRCKACTSRKEAHNGTI